MRYKLKKDADKPDIPPHFSSHTPYPNPTSLLPQGVSCMFCLVWGGSPPPYVASPRVDTRVVRLARWNYPHPKPA